ncbi:class I SAM-dependent methyltransferase [Flavobacterium sp.]|uniref:class I SAM-dependent methyltransferase n=1 Tax=Flavobacterium sp. TaxID=239 RepID=UPI00286C4E19|nr:class I SAM-dependent methyltransferase [Flavobacterium sp.]
MTPKDYNDNFHDFHFKNSINSARQIVPLFLSYFKANTVLDVGCGLGTWLKIFEENQCEVFGIDGNYVQIQDLVIDANKFKPYNLNLAYNLEKKFDLVISLEVAEHILPENAQTYIDSMCLHSDIVLFSAAIPGQEGTLHYNEQYNEYWVALFAQNGFQCIDFLRHEIWNNDKTSWWYRQNILIFIRESERSNVKYDLLTKEKNPFKNSYVHPFLFEYKCNKVYGLEKKVAQLEQVLNNPIQLLKYYLKKVKSKLK